MNGREAVEAVRAALDDAEAYDLICLDIMMPEMDGYEALNGIRGAEEARGILSTKGARVFMTTALNGVKNVVEAFRGLCDVYLCKPIDRAMVVKHLREYRLI